MQRVALIAVALMLVAGCACSHRGGIVLDRPSPGFIHMSGDSIIKSEIRHSYTQVSTEGCVGVPEKTWRLAYCPRCGKLYLKEVRK